MTLKIPEPSIGDKILKFFGKKRGLILPKGYSEKIGVSIYAHAWKENFWKALFRPKSSKLPEDVVDFYNLQIFFDDVRSD